MMLQDRVAIVTGASREIGAAIAEALARDGVAVLVAHYAEPALATAVVERIRAAGGRAEAFDADLSDSEENRRMVAAAVEAFGRLDIFVANAGLTIWEPFLDATEEAWNTLLNLNLRGSFFGAQAAARRMAAQGRAADGYGGRIIFSSSVTGIQSIPGGSVYGMTKAALRFLAQILAVELGGHGITVNALGIGATVNERNLRDDPEYAEHWSALIPTGRVGQPEDVAQAVRFLVSPQAAMITGHTLMIDGGWSTVSPLPAQP